MAAQGADGYHGANDEFVFVCAYRLQGVLNSHAANSQSGKIRLVIISVVPFVTAGFAHEQNADDGDQAGDKYVERWRRRVVGHLDQPGDHQLRGAAKQRHTKGIGNRQPERAYMTRNSSGMATSVGAPPMPMSNASSAVASARVATLVYGR